MKQTEKDVKSFSVADFIERKELYQEEMGMLKDCLYALEACAGNGDNPLARVSQNVDYSKKTIQTVIYAIGHFENLLDDIDALTTDDSLEHLLHEGKITKLNFIEFQCNQERKENYEFFCKENGLDPGEEQSAEKFLDYELKHEEEAHTPGLD